MKYCTFRNATNHNTNECRIFRLHIQKAIEQGKIKFEPAKKLTMDIDKHPFLGVHMVEFQLARGKMKVLTLAKAKEDELVDPKVQISANEYEEAKKQCDQQKSRYEQGETSRAGAMRPRVTSKFFGTSANDRRRRTISTSLKKKNMSVGARKKGMKENKLRYIGIILSSDTARMKV